MLFKALYKLMKEQSNSKKEKEK